MTGTTYTVPPIPPDPEHTTWVDAGPISIGVEYRLLDDADLAANYEGEQMDEIQAATGGAAIEDNGVSLHVSGSADGHEYLRFDLFEQAPHYHYIQPSGEQQTVVEYDRVAMGPMLPWALDQIRNNFSAMLTRAGGEALIAEIDATRLEASLVEVEKLAREAENALASQGDGTRGISR